MVPMWNPKVMMVFKKFQLYDCLVEIHQYFINHIKKLKMQVKFRSSDEIKFKSSKDVVEEQEMFRKCKHIIVNCGRSTKQLVKVLYDSFFKNY